MEEKIENIASLIASWEHVYQERCGDSDPIVSGQQAQLAICIWDLKKIVEKE